MKKEEIKVGSVLIAKCDRYHFIEDKKYLTKEKRYIVDHIGKKYLTIHSDASIDHKFEISCLELYFHLKEETKRIIKQEKHKNNFEEFGFEGNFDGKLYVQDEETKRYHGYIIHNGNKLARSWNSKGISGMEHDHGYDLKPLVKPWYEEIKFPKLLIINDTKLFVAYGINEDNHTIDAFDDEICNVDEARLPTKEEIETLI